MPDADALLRSFEDGSLVRPSAERPNIVALSSAVRQCAGATAAGDDEAAGALAEAIGDCDHLVFVVADGLGTVFLEGLPEDAFLRRHVDRTIDSVYPTSTAPAMFSIASGLWPADHGVLGWFLHLPKLGYAVTPFLWETMREEVRLSELGVTPEDVFLGPRAFDRCTRDVCMLMPSRILGSPATLRTIHPDCAVGIESLEEAVDRVVLRVTSASAPTLTYLYWPSVDYFAHEFGATHPDTLGEVSRIDFELGRLHAGLSGRARLVITADHGHLDYVEEEKLEVDSRGPLAGLLETPPAGEPRILYLHVRSGREREFEVRFREVAGEQFLLLDADEVDEIRLLGPGPLAAPIRERVGNYVAIARGAAGIEFCEPGDRRGLLFTSMHGGLTPAEMRVPLVLA